eukprot:SAG11_NODE_24630_length_370_cov_1.140221_1_plen_61_part_10
MPARLLQVRGDCNITEAVVSDEELRELFDAVDASGDGAMDANEFEAFLSADALAQVRPPPS